MTRPPVIVVMGHIDHGKSTLLDYIRKSNIVAGEAGGITQHIAAYEVEHTTTDGEKLTITFLDTPGHAAFQAMRERGAQVADIAILVVSSEEGVKPQTLEAEKAIKEAGIPYVIAFTKIDREASNIEKAKQSLLEHSIFLEGLGGDIPYTAISAKTGEGIPELLDLIALVRSMNAQEYDSKAPGEAVVVESSRDPKRGIAATVVVKNGTIKSGSFVVSGRAIAPVRIMEDQFGKPLKEAVASTPVKIVGWNELPPVGERVFSVATKKEAEKLVEAVEEARILSKKVPFGVAAIPVIIKADVIGSLEALRHEMTKLENERIVFLPVVESVGSISEGDLMLASASKDAIAIGFNVKVDQGAKDLAERMQLPIKTFSVIYDLVDYLTGLIEVRTPRETVEEMKGRLKILRVFSTAGAKQVIGGRLEEGSLNLDDMVRIVRREVEMGRGKITNLQQSKMDVKEVNEGECGLQIQGKIEVVPGDMIEAVHTVVK